MADFSFSQFQAQMKPIEDLVLSIVRITGNEPEEKQREIGEDLLNQIMVSALVMHLSEQELKNKLPDSETIEKMIDEGRGEDFFGLFAKNITAEKLFQYLQDSASVIMSVYFEKVRSNITPEKIKQIQIAFQEVEERIKK